MAEPAKRGSNNRGRRRETVAARHRKIANQRRDFHHKTIRRLFAAYDLIVVEDLAIAKMLRRAKPVPHPTIPVHSSPTGQRLRPGSIGASVTRPGASSSHSARQSGRCWCILILVVCPAINWLLVGYDFGMRQPVPALEMSAGQREVLESLARSQSGAHREVVRAKALLMAADGVANTAIARVVVGVSGVGEELA